MANNGNQDIIQDQFLAPSLNLDSEYTLVGGNKKSQLKNALNMHIEGFNSEGYWITQEYSNKLCFQFPTGYTYKGAIKMDKEEFAIFFVKQDGITSEIGIFNGNTCSYTKWGESKCFKFEKADWINGVWRYDNITQSRKLYINDGVNPDRIIAIDNPYPKTEIGNLDDTCRTKTYSNELDCEQTLPNQKIKYPCITITKQSSGGLLPNGRYQIAIAGSDGNSPLTDYIISQDVIVYSNSNTNSISVSISNLDTEYDYFHAVLITSLSTGQNLYSLGHFRSFENYNNQIIKGETTINVSDLLNKEPINIKQVLTRKPYYITSNFLVDFEESLIKADITTRPVVYYQEKANKIRSKWKTKLVKAEDAHKYPQHMRDEVYAYFIEWYYKDGEKTEAFHIPNNTPNYTKTFNSHTWSDVIVNDDVDTSCETANKKYFELYTTATDDVVGRSFNICDKNLDSCKSEDFQIGEFGIYESQLKYPDFKIKDENGNDTTKFLFGDLACKPIKLHKFPDNNVSPHYLTCDDCTKTLDIVNVLGISFENIEWPVDAAGNIIEDIVGYRILRSDRANNESILSKGLFANMWYDEVTSKAYYPTIGYGSITQNKFISSTQSETNVAGIRSDINPVNYTTPNNKEVVYTYISPEVCYTAPRQASNVKLYNTQIGCIEAKLSETYNHPRHKFLTEFSKLLSVQLGTLTAAVNYEGSKCTETTITEHISKTSGSTHFKSKEEGKTTGTNFSGSLAGLFGGAITLNQSGSSEYKSETNGDSTINETDVIYTYTWASLTIDKFEGDKYSFKFCINHPLCDPKTTFKITKIEDTKIEDSDDLTFIMEKGQNCMTIIRTGSKYKKLVGNYNPNKNNVTINLFNNEDGSNKTFTQTCKEKAIETKTSSYSNTVKDCNSLSKQLSNGGILSGISFVGDAIKFLEQRMTSFMLGAEAAQTSYETLKNLISYKQYGYQIDSLSTYKFQKNSKALGDIHRTISNIEFMQPTKITVGDTKVNNAWRVGNTFIKVNKKLKNTKEDNSNVDLDNFLQQVWGRGSDINDDELDDWETINNSDGVTSANHYGATYNYNPQQYGNLYNNNLLAIGCIKYPSSKVVINDSEIYFNGDTYISRFSFKNPFNLFEPTYIGREVGYELDYRYLNNIGYPSYWMNTNPQPFFGEFDPSTIISGGFLERPFCFWRYSGFALMDIITGGGADVQDLLQVEGKIVTAINSVYNFFVESSYINYYRGVSELQSHYPLISWTDINRSDKWSIDNQFLYDQSLRVTEVHQNNKVHYSNLNVSNRDRFKVAYSEEVTKEDSYDRWNTFKPLSYMQLTQKDGYLTAVSSYNRQLFLFFEDAVFHTRPRQSLVTSIGDEIYLGVGDIYSLGLQKVAYEDTGLTGCLDRYSIRSSRHGMTWVDRKRKKIWLYTGNPKAISNENTTMWFQEFMDGDYNGSADLLKGLPHKDNIINIYDNHYDKLYYTHKRKDGCNWTLSYKPGIGWISFHSFIPIDYLTLPNNFLSVIGTGIWKHNDFKPNGVNEDAYQTYYGKKEPYYFTYIANGFNNVLQSLQVKHETTTEYSFDERKFHNDIFFNKVNIYSEYGNSGVLDLIVKNPKDRSQQFIHYGEKCVVSHIEQNQWRLNNFRNFATCQPHHKLDCNGFTPLTYNVCTFQNPRSVGPIRGDWFSITFRNDKVYNKRFKTFLGIELVDKIKV